MGDASRAKFDDPTPAVLLLTHDYWRRYVHFPIDGSIQTYFPVLYNERILMAVVPAKVSHNLTDFYEIC